MAERTSWIRHHFPSVTFAVILLAIIVVGALGFIWLGIYNIGADAPHSKIVYNTLDSLRERAIARYSSGIQAPTDLTSAARVQSGAALYDEMCTGCHLGPGLEKSELSQGLYPQAPELVRGSTHTPAQQFWIIKHGVKLSAMPAWGKTHEDKLIWDMVAFIRQLPTMSAAQYKAIVASAPKDHDEMMKDMPGMAGHDEASQKSGGHEDSD